jgi:serine/threonine protein kinase
MSATMKPQTNIALPVGYQLGEYVIESVLGKGGFGITYKARDTKLSATVAIKEYFPQAVATRAAENTIRPFTNGVADFQWGLQEFLKEAQALARFKHQHIVRVLRFVEANATAYMVMEYEEGESLDVYLKRSGGYLNEQMLLNVFIPVLSGLQAVHDAGLLHLDIKPDNIYLRSNGQPMLIDFGSARQAKTDGEQTGKIALTPAYSSIEQYPGIGETGPWSDVYSMGATLYRCITGKAPADSLKRYQAKQAKLVDPYMPATEFDRPIYSKHIRESVDLAMALMPEARPQSAQLLQKALMGQRITEDDGKKVIRPSGNYRPDLIPDVGSPMTYTRKEKTRGFLEKLIFAFVLVPALATFGVKLMVQFEVISEPELFDRIDHIRDTTTKSVSASIDGLDATLYDKWGLRIKPKPKPTVANTASIEPADQGPAPVAMAPFKVDKVVSQTLKGHRAEVVSLAFLRAGDALASLDSEGHVRLWDTVTGQSLHRLGNAGQFVRAIAAKPDGGQLAWAVGQEIYVHDIDQAKDIARISDHDGNVRLLCYSPNGQMLAAVTDNFSIYVWQVPEAKLVHRVNNMPDEINAITFSSNNRLIATADRRGEIHIVAATNGGEIAKFFGAREGESIDALTYSPDGHWLASSGPQAFLKLWDTGIDVNDRLIAGVPGALKALQFSPDSKWLFAAGDGDVIQVWDVDKGVLAKELKTEHKGLTSLLMASNGQVLATAGQDKRIRLWR